MTMDGIQAGIYLHIPFCRARCSYCDFNTYAGLERLYEPYIEALVREVCLLAPKLDYPVGTLFLGGGTPTVLPAKLLRQLLPIAFDKFSVKRGAEVTSEANPGTITLDYLQTLHDLGVNRLSLGAQSFDETELAMLGRIHNAKDIDQTTEWARAAGFDNLNLDLIYGLPGQVLDTWADSLRHALALEPEHISLYCLTVEEGTPLYNQVMTGWLSTPDPDLAADMYELAGEWLAGAGYRQYEISNWSRPGYQCAHNLVYWRNRPYLGLGAGAHSSLRGRRWWNVRPVQSYIDRVIEGVATPWPSPAAQDGEVIDRALEMGETMMLGLRLTQEGIAESDFRQRFGVSLEEVYGDVIQDMQRLGLLMWTDGRLCLTRRGRLLGNQVFAEFLPL
jgi:oxygen-independent coproporphyrinogen-3 oxidase